MEESQVFMIEQRDETSIVLDKLSVLNTIITAVVPVDVQLGEETKYKSLWNDNEQETIKLKILTLIRDM